MKDLQLTCTECNKSFRTMRTATVHETKTKHHQFKVIGTKMELMIG